MSKNNKKSTNYSWIIKIIIIAFVISFIFTFISETSIPKVNIFLGIILTLLFILIGVLFDMIGVAVATANEDVFHSMAAKRVKGARMAVRLKKNADKVSSFCNDVIGDICGIISGSTGAVISLKIANTFNLNQLIVTLVIMGIISSMTIGGKAMEKGLAMNKSNKIVMGFAKVLSIFSKS